MHLASCLFVTRKNECTLTATVTPSICRVGDAVKAKFVNGVLYDAHIASINGHTITVNWSDGYSKYRDAASKDVYKNGVRCQPQTGTCCDLRHSAFIKLVHTKML